MNQATTRSGFLPLVLRNYMRRRAYQLSGLAAGFAGLLLLIALLSYHSGDPSWNTAAGDVRLENWLGRSGAIIADVLLQAFGLGAFFPVFVCFGIAALLWRQQPLDEPLERLLAGLIGCFTVALAAAPWQGSSGFWLWPVGIGGGIGTLLNDLINDSGGAAWSYTGHFVTLLCGGLSLYLLHQAGSWRWRGAFAGLLRLFQYAARAGKRLLGWLHEQDFSLPTFRLPLKRKETVSDVDDVFFGNDTPAQTRTAETFPEFIERPGQKKPAKAKEKKPSAARSSSIPEKGVSAQLPPLSLLNAERSKAGGVDAKTLKSRAEQLALVLNDFGVSGKIVEARPGPVVTLYELEPAAGIKSSRIISLADDIARSMSALSARVAVVPGRNVIGIELPNQLRETVYLRELLMDDSYRGAPARLPLALGKDIGGNPVVADLAKMPHLLVAGTTGSGKSVSVNAMILSLLYKLTPAQCRLIMIDPKMLELSIYDDIPHLLTPVVTDPGKAVVALKWTVKEMEQRYQLMSKLQVRNIDGYNQRLAEARLSGEVLTRRVQTGFDVDTGKPVYEEQPLPLEPLPYIVVIVDEMADLMLVAGKDIEMAIQRLAQMARAAGIHIIMATQRPSVDVITGTIKANFPTRISFQVTSKIDSRTILGEMGAEQLLGQGDMLYMVGGGRISRIHGPFVSDKEVEAVVDFLKAQGAPQYVEDVTIDDSAEGGDGIGGLEGADAMYEEAVAIVRRDGKASTSYIQRQLQIGYNRAARIIEMMEAQGLISKPTATGKREVL